MFAAGTHTTQIVLEWTMAELLRHPNTMKKLQEEVRSIKGDASHMITEEYIALLVQTSSQCLAYFRPNFTGIFTSFIFPNFKIFKVVIVYWCHWYF